MISTTINDDGTVNTSGTTVNSTNSASGTNESSGLGKEAFLQLLVTQMQYQDPLEPTSNTEYIAQLATFSQVEELQNMQAATQQTQASQLVGKVVVMKTENSSGETGYVAGTVDYWETISGTIYLGVNGNLYDIDDLDTVMSDEFYQQYIDGVEDSTDKDDTTDTDDKTDTDDTTDATE